MKLLALIWIISWMGMYALTALRIWPQIHADLSPAARIHHGLTARLARTLALAVPHTWVMLRLYLLGPVGLLMLWLTWRP